MSKARGISDENNPHVEEMRSEILNAAERGYLSASCTFLRYHDGCNEREYEAWVRAATIIQHELDVGWSLDAEEEEDQNHDVAEIRFNWADSQTVNRMGGDDGGGDGLPLCPNCNSSQDVEGPDSDGDYRCTDSEYGCDPQKYFQ